MATTNEDAIATPAIPNISLMKLGLPQYIHQYILLLRRIIALLKALLSKYLL